MKKTYFLLGVGLLSGVANADLLWDFGPSTGTYGGSWVNQSDNQNFAEQVSFANAVTVTRFVYFTGVDPANFTNFEIKLLSDNAGAPDAYLGTQTVGIASSTDLGSGIWQLDLDLTTPWALNASTTYWIGAAGVGFDAGQASVNAPGDGHMAQFSGSAYSFSTGVGDQMFQLVGTNTVPEPASMAAIGLGVAALLRRRRK